MLSVGLRRPERRALVHQISLSLGYWTNQWRLDGRETSWRSFKFQFVAYCGAIDSRLKDLLVLGETSDVAAMRDIRIDPDTRAFSAQRLHADHGVPGGCAEDVGGTRATLRVETHGGCWTSTSQGPQDGSVPRCRNCFTSGPVVTRERWTSWR